MQVFLSPLSVLIRPVERLIDEIRKYQRKRKIKDQFISALRPEIKAYVKSYENFADSGEEQLLPLLRAEPLIPKINKIVRCIADMQLKYVTVLESFVKLAQSCKLLSLNKGFMKYLMEADYSIHDFVDMMARTVVDDSVSVGSDFLLFFRMHGDQATEKVKGDLNMDEVVEEMKPYIDAFKRIRRNARKVRARLTKKTITTFIDSRKKMKKSRRKVRIQKALAIELRSFVRKKFLPIVILLEEALPNFRI